MDCPLRAGRARGGVSRLWLTCALLAEQAIRCRSNESRLLQALFCLLPACLPSVLSLARLVTTYNKCSGGFARGKVPRKAVQSCWVWVGQDVIRLGP